MTLRISKKHGLNPSVGLCFFCGKAKEVLLLGALPNDEQALREAVYDHTPCDECKGYMRVGIIVISVDHSRTSDEKNPYRSGGWVVVRESAVRKFLVDEALLDRVLRSRVMFLDDEAWDRLGFPRDNSETKEGEQDEKQYS